MRKIYKFSLGLFITAVVVAIIGTIGGATAGEGANLLFAVCGAAITAFLLLLSLLLFIVGKIKI